MKLMIASDIHGSAFYCAKLIEAFKREQPDKLVLLGDLIYHGPRNALPEGYETMSVAEQLNSIKNDVLCVAGNCDAEVDQMVLEFPIFEQFRTFELADYRKVYATHGHKYGPHNVPPMLHAGDILLCGHTHVPAWDRLPGGIWYFNPGSVSIPKGASTNSYMILTDTEALWLNFEGSCYHNVDLTKW